MELPKEKLRAKSQRKETPDVAAAGITYHDPQKIVIDGRMGPDYQAETLLHEILHACSYIIDIFECDNEAEEKAIRRLSPVLLNVLRRNPKFVSFLLDPRSNMSADLAPTNLPYYANPAEMLRPFNSNIDQTTLLLEPVGSYPLPVNVNSANADTALAPVNLVRRGMVISNDSTAKLYILFDVEGNAAASATNYTYVIQAGGTFEMEAPPFTGRIRGFWSAANGTASVTDIS